MFTTFLSIGANLGDRLDSIEKSLKHIEETIGEIVTQSSVYETQAWGNTNQPDFLNIAIEVRTHLLPQDLLTQIGVIERDLGRKRKEHWGARTIDIDILFYDNLVIKTPDLTIPHPFLQERAFVLVPLNEITSKYIHPILKKNVQQLYDLCEDKSQVVKLIK
ncbi:2-amino-4-hydroxy-6-hydroxymethyldihydropteridine diphosphokinase [Pseudopedobacter beijingensis]|uniref:2-amino-4-hydroxy-6-hydroxymethyldihydropteridine pyrophosphokinase n=1 Tax=Pseudopedobacter beijingensis TaxID=1207056 RepID=A0ABW4IFW3_9SPHI